MNARVQNRDGEVEGGEPLRQAESLGEKESCPPGAKLCSKTVNQRTLVATHR